MDKFIVDGAGRGRDVGAMGNGDGIGSLYSSFRVSDGFGDGFGSESGELDGDGRGSKDEDDNWGQPSER